MGLLKHLLFWPATGPEFLIRFSLEKVEGVVREELTDDTPVKADLLELQMLLELGDIDDDEYVRREAALMQRLRDVRDWRERFGMGVSGGPVKVAGAGEEAEPPEPAAETSSPERAPEEGDGGDAGDEGRDSGGIASPEGADIELNLGFDDEE